MTWLRRSNPLGAKRSLERGEQRLVMRNRVVERLHRTAAIQVRDLAAERGSVDIPTHEAAEQVLDLASVGF